MNQVEKFDQLVKQNKNSGKEWYCGLTGKWWWGLSEEDARKKLATRRTAIASIIRNEESNGNLKKFLNCCEDLEQYHQDLIYIFIEGDSSDNTYGKLQEWLIPRKNYILKKIDKQKPLFYKTKSAERTVYLASLRNMLVDLAFSIPDLSEILMIDANYVWKGDLISSLREIDSDIAAPLTVSHKDRKGRYLFYDVWAFRKNGKQFSQHYPYIKRLSNKPFNLDSVGGGYLLRREVLEEDVRYNGDKDCEHVGFCKDAKRKGFTIKINPKVYIKKSGT